MWKKFAAVGMACLLLYTILFREQPMPPLVYPVDQITPPELISAVPDECAKLVAEINAKNARINTVSCNRLSIKISNKITRLSGTINYEKPNHFHMTVDSILGEELNIGSNDTNFWFCSRRFQQGTLFYAKHGDLPNARLKTPLNPNWLIESMGFKDVKLEGCTVSRAANYWAVSQMRTSANNEQIKIVTLIDPLKKVIVGRYMYDDKGNIMASVEVKSFVQRGDFLMPDHFTLSYQKEGLSMEISMPNPWINTAIPASTWQMPAKPKQVDMAKD